MRKSRSELLPSKGVHHVFIANTIHQDIPEIDLESREVLRNFIFDELEKHDVELLHWCITPRSYRAVVECDLGSKGKTPIIPMFEAIKLAQQRYGAWKRRNDQPHSWKDRVRTSWLDTPELLASAAISCDVMPLIQGISSSPDDYFFTSYWHAKQDDNPTIQSVRKILNLAAGDWKSVRSEYRKILKKTAISR